MRALKILTIIAVVGTIILTTIFMINIAPIVLNTQSKLVEKYVGDYNITKYVAKMVDHECKTMYSFIDKDFCRWNTAALWVLKNIRYKNDSLTENAFYTNNSPELTYKNGNDCDGIAIFFINVLKELGFKKVYIAFQGINGKSDHLCVLWDDDTQIRKFNCFTDREIIYVKRVL